MPWLNSFFSPTSHFNLLKTRNNVLLPISSNKNIKFIFTDGVGLGRHLAPPSILQWVWFYHVIKRDAGVQFRAKNENSLKKNPLETANTWEKVKCRLIYHFRILDIGLELAQPVPSSRSVKTMEKAGGGRADSGREKLAKILCTWSF